MVLQMNKHTPLQRNEAGIKTALDILKQRFGDRCQTGQTIREQHAHTTTIIPNQPPDCVVFAHSTNDVSEIARIASDYNVPIIPFGTGTSLEGHVNAPVGGISLDVSQMDKVLAVYPEDLCVVVQPGVTRKALNEELRATGLFFPIDPGADASLGGMAATRASGTNAVRYGTMKENVMGLECVLASGQIIRTGGRVKKSSVGYDLTRLMVGSEGTLGLITEVTLKLHGLPEAMASARCTFPSVEAACTAVIATIQMGIPVARIELLDALNVQAINAYSGLDLPVAPLLLLEFHGSQDSVAEQSELFGQIAEDVEGSGFEWTTKAEERTKLWQARHDAYWAQRQFMPNKSAVASDVCVPISKLAEAVTGAQKRAEELDLVAPILGHVGDGNFHATVFVDANDADEVARSHAFLGWLNDQALALDGTISGEHGIGQGKMKYVDRELGAAADVMRTIKMALDPQNIMNPGKIFDLESPKECP